MPRMQIKHTSAAAAGQIYIPVINWALMVMVIVLVLFFRSSTNLAAAYGIAVTGAMFIDTILLAVVLISAVELAGVEGAAAGRGVHRRRHGLSRREPDQGARWRLVAAG